MKGRAAGEIEISIVPVRDGRFEPFAAAWHVSALPVLRAGLAAGHSLQRIYADLQATGRLWPQAMAPDEAAWFTNLNTPADLVRASA